MTRDQASAANVEAFKEALKGAYPALVNAQKQMSDREEAHGLVKEMVNHVLDVFLIAEATIAERLKGGS